MASLVFFWSEVTDDCQILLLCPFSDIKSTLVTRIIGLVPDLNLTYIMQCVHSGYWLIMHSPHPRKLIC